MWRVTATCHLRLLLICNRYLPTCNLFYSTWFRYRLTLCPFPFLANPTNNNKPVTCNPFWKVQCHLRLAVSITIGTMFHDVGKRSVVRSKNTKWSRLRGITVLPPRIGWVPLEKTQSSFPTRIGNKNGSVACLVCIIFYPNSNYTPSVPYSRNWIKAKEKCIHRNFRQPCSNCCQRMIPLISIRESYAQPM